jgi:ferric-dicitrate binding protein FerR (iron transport regulator)
MSDDSSLEHFSNAERIAFLIAGHINGTLTPLEKKELDEWISASDENIALFEKLVDEWEGGKAKAFFASIDKEKALARVKKRIGFKHRKLFFSFPVISAAASLLLVIALSIFLLTRDRKNAKIVTMPIHMVKDPLPGKDKAVLQLADGKVVMLDSSATALFLLQQGVTIKAGTEGELIYQDAERSANHMEASPVHNILSTPRGGQYKISLSDGTKVWLNAESSIRYPVLFTGNAREVMISGEAYFEVAKNGAKPFIVKSSSGKDWSVTVLGTHFTIDSYGEENDMKATLVEGKVMVQSGKQSLILSPGEEAVVKEKAFQKGTGDIETATGWKEGEFVFRGAPVPVVMNSLARWYDLHIEYGTMPSVHLNAKISRNVSLRKVLGYLQGTGAIHFRLDGKKLTVMQ